MNNKLRYAIIMALGVCMNEVLYAFCMAFELPIWMDMSGTIFAALLLEPAAGLIVGLINNFILAAFYYNSASLIFYAVSAAAALIVGVVMRKDGKIDFKRVVPTLLLLIVATSLLTGLLTLWQQGGALNLVHPWEVRFFEGFNAQGIPPLLSYFISILIVKTFDAIANLALALFLCKFLPKKLRGTTTIKSVK